MPRIPAGGIDLSIGIALAAWFVIVQFYTSLASLSPTPPVGYVVLPRAVAVAMVAVMAAASVLFASRLARVRGAWTGTVAALSTWVGAALLSTILGFDPRTGLQIVGILTMSLLFHAILVRFYPKPPVAALLIAAFLVTGVAACIVALVMQSTRVPGLLYTLNHGRAAGLFVTSNQLAAYLVTFVPTAFGVAMATNHRWLRTLGWLAVLSGIAAMFETYSFGGWAGLAIAIAFIAIILRHKLPTVLIVATLLAALVFFAVRPASHHNSSEMFIRIAAWQAGAYACQLFPVTGVGPMAYWRVYPEIRQVDGPPPGSFAALHPHNVVLSLCADTGMLGVGAFVFGGWTFAGCLRAALRGSSTAGRVFGLAVAAGLAGTLVQGMVDTVGVVEEAFVWIPFTALALAAARDGLAETSPERPLRLDR